jgi:hypothetical protein
MWWRAFKKPWASLATWASSDCRHAWQGALRPPNTTTGHANVTGVNESSPEHVGAENLCHQAILVKHASSTVTPPDAEVV